MTHVRFWAHIENVLIVVSDMADGKSHIIAGGFARNLDIGDYQQENSIWESKILSLMSPEEQEERMYYIFNEHGENLRYAICIYSPMPFDFKGKSFAVQTSTSPTGSSGSDFMKRIFS